MRAPEGTATVTDAEGNLKFFSDGAKVWSSPTELMRNGDYLVGDPSSTMAPLVIGFQAPDQEKYFLFTTGANEGDYRYGLSYSIIEFDRRGGEGRVTEKNTPVDYWYRGERLIAMPNADSTSVWLITYGGRSNYYTTYQVTICGVKEVGSFQAGEPYSGGDANGIGNMKFSPDGRQLAIVNRFKFGFELFSFNRSTGKLSDPRLISNSALAFGYGIEYSADGEYLFVDAAASVWQYRLSDMELVAEFPLVGGIRGMKRAPNGDIFVTEPSKSFLHRMYSQDGDHYLMDTVWIDTGQVWFNLPSTPVVLNSAREKPLPLELPATVALCPDEQFEIHLPDQGGGAYRWSDGVNESDRSLTEPGVYFVSYVGACDVLREQIEVAGLQDPIGLGLTDTTLFCEELSLNLTYEGEAGVVWPDGTEGATYTIEQEGTYEVRYFNGCGETIETFEVAHDPKVDGLPNAFSPNHDGVNDALSFSQVLPAIPYSLTVFNRWGESLYQSEIYKNDWEGHELEPGTYFYSLEIPGCDSPIRSPLHVIK